jgi:TIR domain
MDAFISHSSANRAIAATVERRLEAAGLRVWLDDSEIRLGVLLGTELQESISMSRVLLLLWSEHAATSRWVASEWLTAFHLDRFIIPCRLDPTPLPQCLQNSVFIRMRRMSSDAAERLVRAIGDAPDARNPVSPFMRAESAELTATIRALVDAQQAVTDRLGPGALDEARELQLRASETQAAALETWPLDPVILNLAGYDRKNAYLVEHWDAVQAGRAPRDPLLDEAERHFFDTLSVDPTDPSALNGLGSILMFKRDLDAAEFFILAALAEAKRRGITYPAAEHDLALVRRFKP